MRVSSRVGVSLDTRVRLEPYSVQSYGLQRFSRAFEWKEESL